MFQLNFDIMKLFHLKEQWIRYHWLEEVPEKQTYFANSNSNSNSKANSNLLCVKSVRIWSFSGPYFPGFGLNTGRHGVSMNAGKYGPEKL